MIKNIIFDLDGTLLFLSPVWVEYYKRFIEKYNLNITPQKLYISIGNYEKLNNDALIDLKRICEFLSEENSIIFSQAMFIDLLEIYKNIPLTHINTVFKILTYLSGKYNLYAYTNWFTLNQEYRLKKYDLLKFFQKIYGWDILPTKPSIIGLDKIVNCRDIKEFIMIGDSLQTDLDLPCKKGMHTIFLNRKNIIQDKHLEINNINELKRIL